MQTRPTHIKPQTLRQAKAQYKKHGPRLSSQEQRRLDRSNELEQRAEAIREAEQRRKKNAEKRRQREERVREERRRLNIKSPEPWISPRQTKMANFFRCSKSDIRSDREKDEAKLSGSAGKEQEDETEVETEPDTDTDENQGASGGTHPGEAQQQDSTSQKFESFTISEDLLAALDSGPATQREVGKHKTVARDVQIRSQDTVSSSQYDALLSIAREDEFALPLPTQDLSLVWEKMAAPGTKRPATSSPVTQHVSKRTPTNPEASLFSSFPDASLLNGLEKVSTEQLMQAPVPPQSVLQHDAREPWESELSTQDFCLGVS